MNHRAGLSELRMDTSVLMPGLSIDCVIVGYDHSRLHILVTKVIDTDIWSLPGGFIRKDENMDQAASRILEERSGMTLPYLQQFYTFGDVNRRKHSPLQSQLKSHIQLQEMLSWLEQRFISTGYLSLVDMRKSNPSPDVLSEVCRWIPVNELPDLLYDHGNIVKKALEHVRNQINYMPVGKSLLPERFTMKEFQLLYESILGRELDRSNFQKKMLRLGFLKRHEKMKGGGSHKAPYLYSFDTDTYNELLEKGIGYMS
jgi:ADP-ribose pyrophosphatase YjhB (NUDIX family)